MSVKTIEAEVYIRSSVEADVEIGREVIKVVEELVTDLTPEEKASLIALLDGPDTEPIDPNVIEGEFIGTETGVLTIDLPYTGDRYPKGIYIWDADGIHEDEPPRAFTITAYCAFKNNAQEPTYNDDAANNGFRYQVVYTGTATYTSTGGASSYIFSQTEPAMGGVNSVKMPDNKTLKIHVTDSASSTATRFRVGILYKYNVFY